MTGKNMYTSVLYTNLLCRNARCSWKWEQSCVLKDITCIQLTLFARQP